MEYEKGRGRETEQRVGEETFIGREEMAWWSSREGLRHCGYF